MNQEYKSEECLKEPLFNSTNQTHDFKYQQLRVSISNFQKSFLDFVNQSEEEDISHPNLLLASNKLSLRETLPKVSSCLQRFIENNPFHDLPNEFPYKELCHLLNTSQNPDYQKYSLQCLFLVLNFFNSNDGILTEAEIESICSIMQISQHPANNLSLQMIFWLIKQNPELCMFFHQQNLPQILYNHSLNRTVIDLIGIAFEYLDLQISVQYLFVLLHFFDTDDLCLKRFLYNLLGKFIEKFEFDSLPESFTENQTKIETIPFIYTNLTQEIDQFAQNPYDYDFINSLLKFCLCLPPLNPPDIFNQIVFFLLIHEAFDHDESNTIHQNSAKVMIHFCNPWKEIVTQNLLDVLAKKVLNRDLDFETKFQYTQVVLTYHTFQNSQFDTVVIQLCLEYLNNLNKEFAKFCISKLHQIFIGFTNINNAELLQESTHYLLYDIKESFVTLMDTIDSDSTIVQIGEILQIINDFMKQTLTE